MLIRLSEARTALGGFLGDEKIVAITSGIGDSLHVTCNRMFPKQVESVAGSGSTATLTVYRHGLQAGSKVSLASPTGDTTLDIATATVLATGLTADAFQVTLPTGTVTASANPNLTMRKVLTQINQTRGETSTFVPYRPLASVVSMSRPDGSGGWTAYPAASYVIAGGTNDGLSLSGEIALVGERLASGLYGERWHPAGVRIEYVAGEPVLPERARYFMTNAISAVYGRLTASGMQSENIDYYSYSRLSSSEVGQLFGESDQIIRQLRISA